VEYLAPIRAGPLVLTLPANMTLQACCLPICLVERKCQKSVVE